MTEQTLSRFADIFRLHELPGHKFEPLLYTNRKGQSEGGFKIYRDGELLEVPVASEPSGLYYYLKSFSGRVRQSGHSAS